MQQQCAFHFGAGNVIAGAHDHVIGTRLENEVTGLVDQIGVPGVIPAVLHVLRLARIGEVTAACRPLDREPPDDTCRHRPASVVHHAGCVPGNREARRPGTRVRFVVRNENMKQLGRADAVDNLDTGRRFPQLPRCGGQRFAGRNALAQRVQITLCRHSGQRAVGCRCGKQHGCLVLGNRCQQRVRRRLFEQQRRRADAQGKQQ